MAFIFAVEQFSLHAQVGKHALQPPVLVFKSRSRFSRTSGVHRSLWLIIDASTPPYLERHLQKLAVLIPLFATIDPRIDCERSNPGKVQAQPHRSRPDAARP